MSTLGCHSCEVNLQDYKDIPYQNTPCAKCRLSRDSQQTFKRISLFDTDASVDDLQDTVAASQQQGFSIPTWVPKEVVQQIQKACQNNMLVTLGNIILRMVKLSRQHPITAQILMIKMQHPNKSYYEIGQLMSPRCSKQNVLYHLKHAVQIFPQLSNALLIDTRFSGCGKSAIQSVAKLRNNQRAVSKLQTALYPATVHNQPATIQQINTIFNMPYSRQVLQVNCEDI